MKDARDTIEERERERERVWIDRCRQSSVLLPFLFHCAQRSASTIFKGRFVWVLYNRQTIDICSRYRLSVPQINAFHLSWPITCRTWSTNDRAVPVDRVRFPSDPRSDPLDRPVNCRVRESETETGSRSLLNVLTLICSLDGCERRGYAIHGSGTDDGEELRAAVERRDQRRATTGDNDDDRYRTMSDIALSRSQQVLFLFEMIVKSKPFSESSRDGQHADDRDAGEHADRPRELYHHHDATGR